MEDSLKTSVETNALMGSASMLQCWLVSLELGTAILESGGPPVKE